MKWDELKPGDVLWCNTTEESIVVVEVSDDKFGLFNMKYLDELGDCHETKIAKSHLGKDFILDHKC